MHFTLLLVLASLMSLLACGSPQPVDPDPDPAVDAGAQADSGTGEETDAGSKGDAGMDAGMTVEPLEFQTAHPATQVIGQPDFATGTIQATSATSLASAYGRAEVLGGRVYVASYPDNRVLGFNALPTGNQPAADFVLGQPDFTSNAAGAGAAELAGPAGVAVDGDRLLVLDFDNNRVLVWNTPPASNAEPADLVIGQADFNLNAFACASNALSSPEDFLVVGGKLIVSDSSNHRVLIWNSVPTTSGVAADLVLGQSNFTSCAQNRGSAVGADTFNFPTGLWSDGTRLLVADYNNHRILVWNQFPTTNGQAADAVIGQADFSANTGGTSASALSYPYFLASNGTQLFVADNGNHRVLVWNAFPSGAAPADVVLGQQDFTHGASNDQDGDGVSDGPSAQTLNSPQGLTLIDGRLMVMDGKNHRALFYEPL